MPDQLLAQLGAAALNFALAALVVAVFTMLFLQAVYGLGLRSLFQRRLVRSWMWRRWAIAIDGKERPDRSRGRRISVWWPWSSPPPEVRTLELILNRLAGGGRSLFGLSYAQLCGQVAAALQAENDSDGSRYLTWVFAQGAGPNDLKKARADPPPKELPPEEAPVEKAPAAGAAPESPAPADEKGSASDAESLSSSGASGAAPSKKADSEADVLFRVRFHAERGVDDLQAYLSRRTQMAEYGAALAVTVSLLWMLSTEAAEVRGGPLTHVVVAVAASLLVPVLRVLLERAVVGRQA